MNTRLSPLRLVDGFLDRITMYRLLLYVLLAYIGVAALLAFAHLLSFSPIALLASTAFLALIAWAANTLLGWIFRVPTNVESSIITALILALIIDPAKTSNDWQFLGWAAILAMASKFVLSLWNKHIFNPAAIAVVITAFALGDTASWWVGSASMIPVTLIGGYLIVRKVRQEGMVGVFLLAAVLATCAVSALMGLPLTSELRLLVIESPLFFLGSIMLTEPLTAPPTQRLRYIYAALVGALIVPQIHLGALYSTPELALSVGNVYSYIVSPKRKLALRLRKRTRLAPDILEFVFRPAQRLAFEPGQYMEFTLGHQKPDGRGNRRYFTLASSPTEDQMRLGVRFYPQGSSFKRALARMDGRTDLLAGQIAGDFTLPRDPNRKLAFIAGGIGVTPFRSMLKYLIDTRQGRDIVMLYANRAPQDIVYQDVLSEAEKRLGARVVHTLTDPAMVPNSWQGAQGRVDAQMIAATIPDYRNRTFYLSGPPEMVRATAEALGTLGVRRSQIKRDYFPGLA
ncbi:MAG TPA: oxidoreductase [Ktedonobacterales bacterium]|nr:oxidoreductase [Ktedonobacterales bacterium]